MSETSIIVKSNWRTIGLAVTAGFTVAFLGYGTPRFYALQVQAAYALLFLSYILLANDLRSNPRLGIYISIGLRLVLLFSIPSLSDDFNRFIWDARLFVSGINPFHEVPDFFMQGSQTVPGIDIELYNRLNFTQYHSMYPPVAQFTGWISVLLGGDSIFWTVVFMRVFVLGAEIGSIYLIYHLLKERGKDVSGVLWYALNPLVILELSGNLHHEAYVIFFTLLAIYLLQKKRMILSAGSFSLAVASKLLPLIFLPLLIKRLGVKNAGLFYLYVVLGTLILFLPFLDMKLFQALANSGWLYFQRFEFNGSVYYLVREIGFMVKGYNIIQTSGRWMAALTFFFIIGYSIFQNTRRISLPEAFLWVLTFYLVFATTLHPWYILPLIAYCVFTNYRYPVVWSYLIFLTYSGYTESGYNEPLGLILVEYLLVYGVMIYEILRYSRIKAGLGLPGPLKPS